MFDLCRVVQEADLTVNERPKRKRSGLVNKASVAIMAGNASVILLEMSTMKRSS